MGTHPIFESDFDCLTEIKSFETMSSSKIPCEICVDTTEIKSYQNLQIRAKFTMTTISNLEDIKLKDDCKCDVKEACPPAPSSSSSSSSSSSDDEKKNKN